MFETELTASLSSSVTSGEAFEQHDKQREKHGPNFFPLLKADNHSIRTKYFTDNGKTFSPQACAHEIGRNQVFRTHPTTNDLYFYNDQTNLFEKAEKLIGVWAEKHLWDYTSSARVSEIYESIKRSSETGKKPPARYVQLQNCTFDLIAGKPIPKDPTLFFTKQLPFNYDPNASCEAFAKFLEDVQPGNKITQKQLLEFIAYCFYAERPIQRSCFLLYGQGANGKSSFLKVIRAMLGKNNYSSLSLHEIEERFGPNQLLDMYANIEADLPSDALKKTNKFKKLSGNDSVFCDRKGKEGYDAEMPIKFIFSANNPPEVPDQEPAFFRRWLLIEFSQNFEGREQKGLEEVLQSPSQLSGIFNLVLPLLPVLLERNEFSYAPKTREIQEIYMTISRPLFRFIRERIDYINNPGPERKIDVYRAYIEWAKKNKKQQYNHLDFCKRFLNEPEIMGLVTIGRMPVDSAYMGQPAFLGVSLLPEVLENPKKTSENGQNSL
ncbi:MAG: phage/plasmid primase, P4 family [Patescibacteria group bacterium]|jgi:P4 family phage/plasmid primase-like protien